MTVETEKSTRIFTSAFTWFFLRTVPNSRNAKPACMASTMMPPSRMNKASEPCFSASISPSLDKSPVIGAFSGVGSLTHHNEAITAPDRAQVAALLGASIDHVISEAHQDAA